MNDAILKQMVDELAAIRELLAKVLGSQQESQELADTKAEIDMVDTMGIDPITYIKDKCRKERTIRKSSKKPASSRLHDSTGTRR